MTQYRIEMLEAAVEEGFGQGMPPMNLADLRSQLERYRAGWDHSDLAVQEIITIPQVKIQICEKGYLAYVFRNDSNAMLCVRVIRLPSTCNGVTREEWQFKLESSPPDVMVLGMTLQPEFDLLVVIVSSDPYAYVLAFTYVAAGLTLSSLGSRISHIHTLKLSNGQPHPAIPTLEPIHVQPGFRFIAAQPYVTKSRLAFLYLQPGSEGACTFRVHELWTGRVILV